MVRMPAGTFQMGLNQYERPVHEVTLPAFSDA